MINVMINDNTIGIHKYITCNMFRQDSGWIVASFTNPLASSNHPQRATPIPPPIFVPKEVQEYIVPSMCLCFVRYVYSEQLATTAPYPPAWCHSKRCNCCKCKHKWNAAHITGKNHSDTSCCSENITSKIHSI